MPTELEEEEKIAKMKINLNGSLKCVRFRSIINFHLFKSNPGDAIEFEKFTILNRSRKEDKFHFSFSRIVAILFLSN